MNLILIPAALVLATLLFYYPLDPQLIPSLRVATLFLLGIAFVVAIFQVFRRRKAEDTLKERKEEEDREAIETHRAPVQTEEASVVQFLAQLQEKGRLVDFAMDDIAPYSDEQVGAAARVVHQGCREVLSSTFAITPVHSGAEGEEVTLSEDYDARLYRLMGRVPERPPYRGTVLHRGWKTEKVNIPRITDRDAAREVIAPAEVDLG